MLADYMERGFLDNIIDMFKHDRSLYCHLPHLMSDERTRVRLGAVALIETLRGEHYEDIVRTIPPLAGPLRDENPTIRADAAYLLGIIGHRDALEYLKAAADDAHPFVREAVRDSIGICSA